MKSAELEIYKEEYMTELKIRDRNINFRKCLNPAQGLIFLVAFMALSPGAFSDDLANSAEITALERQIRNHEGHVSRDERYFNECMDQCTSLCRSRCDNNNSDNSDSCKAGCPSSCETGTCSSKKAKYETEKQKLDDKKEALARLRGQEAEEAEEDGEGEKSPLEQVKEGKEDMDLYKILGVGTTAYLTYEAVSCCSQCGGSNPSCCGPCPVWMAMAAAAGFYTNKMFDKADEYDETCKAMQAENPDVDLNCDGDDDRGPDDPNLTPDPPPPCDTNPEMCPPPPTPDPPPNNCATNPSECTPAPFDVRPPDPIETIKEKLGPDFEPPGGWPDPDGNGSGGIGSKGFSYDDLTPAMKKKLNAFNKRKKAYLAKRGKKEEDLKESARTPSAKVAGFVGEEAGGSLTGNLDESPVRPKKKKDLAKQMQEMLNKLYGKGHSAAKKQKSVQFGSDVVGVAEDNIFMMVHRRHRALDQKNRFIKEMF